MQLTPAKQKSYVGYSGENRYHSMLLPASYGRGRMGVLDGFIPLCGCYAVTDILIDGMNHEPFDLSIIGVYKAHLAPKPKLKKAVQKRSRPMFRVSSRDANKGSRAGAEEEFQALVTCVRHMR